MNVSQMLRYLRLGIGDSGGRGHTGLGGLPLQLLIFPSPFSLGGLLSPVPKT